jgi:hypothetical protein
MALRPHGDAAIGRRAGGGPSRCGRAVRSCGGPGRLPCTYAYGRCAARRPVIEQLERLGRRRLASIGNRMDAPESCYILQKLHTCADAADNEQSTILAVIDRYYLTFKGVVVQIT